MKHKTAESVALVACGALADIHTAMGDAAPPLGSPTLGDDMAEAVRSLYEACERLSEENQRLKKEAEEAKENGRKFIGALGPWMTDGIGQNKADDVVQSIGLLRAALKTTFGWYQESLRKLDEAEKVNATMNKQAEAIYDSLLPWGGDGHTTFDVIMSGVRNLRQVAEADSGPKGNPWHPDDCVTLATTAEASEGFDCDRPESDHERWEKDKYVRLLRDAEAALGDYMPPKVGNQSVRSRILIGIKALQYDVKQRPALSWCDARFAAVLNELAALNAKKAKDYGKDEDAFANCRASEAFGVPAWAGVLIRANDKMKRLQTFAVKGTLANEGAEDSLIDLAAYAIIALILFRETQQTGDKKEAA